jgi:putative transposase
VFLIWDNLSAHKAKITTAFIETQKSWLKAYRFPSYAPELNPVEYLWSSGKSKDLAHLYVDAIDNLDIHIRRYKKRVQRQPDRLTGFLKKSALFKKELLI